MVRAFKVKVRKIGTSAGVLISRDRLAEAQVGIGEEVEVVILSHKPDFSAFGIAKGFRPFKRDKKIRFL